jgi:hypothetical protein
LDLASAVNDSQPNSFDGITEVVRHCRVAQLMQEDYAEKRHECDGGERWALGGG